MIKLLAIHLNSTSVLPARFKFSDAGEINSGAGGVSSPGKAPLKPAKASPQMIKINVPQHKILNKFFIRILLSKNYPSI